MEKYSIYHDSRDLKYRTPFGAVTLDKDVTIRIKAKGCEAVELEVICFNGEKHTIIMDVDSGAEDTYSAVIKSQVVGVINYYFKIRYSETTCYYGNNEEGLGGVGKVSTEIPKGYQLTVYEDFNVPKWYKEGIMYQIFVDSFCNGNSNGEPITRKKNSFIYGHWDDDPMYIKDEKGSIIRWAYYGGNLRGVIKKLPYLKSLGVTIIYLNPIFQASSTHRYDTGDYLKIDDMFGDDLEFKELCSAAKDMGMRIILDGVFNHTGDDSVYFNKHNNYDSIGAYQSMESPYYKWYKFKDYPTDYDCWWGVETLPDVNELEQSYVDFIIDGENSVINKWMKLGAAGWRLDVADELPDLFIEKIKTRIKEENKDSVLIGEVWEDASNKESHGEKRKYVFGKELDSVMNYPFRNMVIDFFIGNIDSYIFKNRVLNLQENYPVEFFYGAMNLLGSHDSERILSVYLNHVQSLEKAIKLLKLSSLLQMTFPGVPCIYYGDEAGVTGGKDPDNRKSYPWGHENGEIIAWYRDVTKIRVENEIFKSGEIKFHDISKEVICYTRVYRDEIALIAINRSDSEKEITFNLDENAENIQDHCYDKNKFRDILSKENSIISCVNGVVKFKLKPLEGKVLLQLP